MASWFKLGLGCFPHLWIISPSRGEKKKTFWNHHLLTFFSLFCLDSTTKDISIYLFGCNKNKGIQFNSPGLTTNQTWLNTQSASHFATKKVTGKGQTTPFRQQNAPPPLPLPLPFSCKDNYKKSQWQGRSVFAPFLTRMTKISVIPGSTPLPPCAPSSPFCRNETSLISLTWDQITTQSMTSWWFQPIWNY